MPKPPKAVKAIEAMRKAGASPSGLPVRLQLSTSIPGVPAGGWVFGRVYLDPTGTKVKSIEFEGESVPPRR